MIDSELKVTASEKLAKEVENELKKEDPAEDKAKASINENATN